MNEDKKGNRLHSLVDKAYFKMGLAVFIVGLALILSVYIINNFSVISAQWRRINSILLPFYLGIVMAYLMCPTYNATVKWFYKVIKDRLKTPKKAMKLSRVVGTLVSLLIIILVIVGLIMMIIPNLYESITTLVPRLPGYVNSTIKLIEAHLNDDNVVSKYISENLEKVSDNLGEWLQNKLLPASEVIISRVSSGVAATIDGIFDFLVALIICVYILNSKELFIAQSKKFINAVFSKSHAEAIFELGRISNNTFGGFINGKIVDSIIIGILCFIAMTILNLPMAMMISVVVGVTNIIPFFGPFIGAIPSALLLLLIKPVAALEFVILIVVLQQLDGNIIGPKILGKATKLSSFWVMFAIIVGGGLFGFLGMILGVPVFAVIYSYLAKGINRRLNKKNIESDTLAYEDLSKYGVSKTELFGKERATDGPVKIEDTASQPEDN